MKKIVKKSLFGVFSIIAFSLTLTTNLRRNEAVAQAQEITPNTTLYFSPNSGWTNDGARFAAYFFNSDTDNSWQWMNPVSGSTNVYSVSSGTTKNYKTVIFCRMNPAGPLGWGGKWNQTGDLTYTSPNDYYVVPDGWWDFSGDAYWQMFTPLIKTGTVFYLRTNATFMGAADRVKAYFFNGTNSTWVDAMPIDTNIYKVTSPSLGGGALPNTFIGVSMNGENTPVDWTTKVSQTDDLGYHVTKGNLYDVGTKEWIKGYVEPAKLTPVATAEGVNINKLRIWINRNNHYAGTDSRYLLRVGSTFYSMTGYSEALKFDPDDIYFAFIDIDKSVVLGKEVGLTITNQYEVKQVDIPGQTFASGDNSKLWTVNYNETTKVWSYSKGAVVGRILNTYLAKVLEGYLSCEASLDNGYLAFDLINTNFIPTVSGGNWNMEGMLSDPTNTIKDYAAIADYSTGTRSVTINAQTKYDMLRTQYEGRAAQGVLSAYYPVQDNTLFMMLFFLSFGMLTYFFLRVFRRKVSVK
jgi:hypothetical protein